MTTWLEDSNGNKCSIEYFGSKEAAVEALKKARDDIAKAGKAHVQAGWDYSHCSLFQGSRIKVGQTISPESGFTYYSPGNEVLKYAPSQTEDPYLGLARHHELKSILNSGMLTKSEKRKVFGLPELKEGEND